MLSLVTSPPFTSGFSLATILQVSEEMLKRSVSHSTPVYTWWHFKIYSPISVWAHFLRNNDSQMEVVERFMCALGHFNWPLNVETSLFVCNRGDTIQYHGGLRSRELGQAPMLLVFLNPRQALSSHPRQQMV